MSQVLQLARSQLASGEPSANRRACWLARAALEEVLNRLLTAKGLDVGPRASTRAKLSCLEVAYAEDPALAARVQYVWSRLSDACHHHAYELAPTAVEVAALLDGVGVVLAALPASRVDQPAGAPLGDTR